MEKIKTLPEVLEIHIFEYIPNKDKYMLNRLLFEKFYDVPKYIKKNKECLSTSYLRKIVQNDLHYVFEYILDRYLITFLKMMSWIWKDRKYIHFVEFLKYIAIENNSTRCINIINKKNKKKHYSEKYNKKNKSKNNIWSN